MNNREKERELKLKYEKCENNIEWRRTQIQMIERKTIHQ
jgi:hypothetical protein